MLMGDVTPETAPYMYARVMTNPNNYVVCQVKDIARAFTILRRDRVRVELISQDEFLATSAQFRIL